MNNSEEIRKNAQKQEQENGNIQKALLQSLLRQALGEKFIKDRVIDDLKEEYSTKEILYRYYDHAERGIRQAAKFKELVAKINFGNDALAWQKHILELTDCIGSIAICFRAVKDYKKDYMKDEEPCLSGGIRDMKFDDILHEIANGVAHVREGNNSPTLLALRELNEVLANRELRNRMGGPEHHEAYSTRLSELVVNLIRENFVDRGLSFFHTVIEDVRLRDPELLEFKPYIVEMPRASESEEPE